jgi:DNA modification methylase
LIQVLIGDAIERLRELPSESVHCVVTSPPYWGLRDYSRCPCAQVRKIDSTSFQDESHQGGAQVNYRQTAPDPECPVCHGTGIIEGVKEHQLGLEKTPEEYVQHLVEVFREVWRVLRDDGVLFLNMGDSYWGGGLGHSNQTAEEFQKAYPKQGSNRGLAQLSGQERKHLSNLRQGDECGLKPKDLVGIPWRVAFALQADGWYLRSDIIWSKPNPMPESVTDRPTKSHEYVFLLTKNARYFYDQEAIREPQLRNWSQENHGSLSTTDWLEQTSQHPRGGTAPRFNPSGRNIRTVWEITTQPYPEAHFATFPEELPRRCIKAGTSLKGCCPKCGAPWERIIEYDFKGDSKGMRPDSNVRPDHLARPPKGARNTNRIIGWQPTCECGEAETIPCTVLDPFAGSGTTGWVARSLGRKAILIELNPIYGDLIRKRAMTDVPDLLSFDEPEVEQEQLGDGKVKVNGNKIH